MMRPIGWHRSPTGLVVPVYSVSGGGDWPATGDGQRMLDSGISASTQPGTTLTAPATPNTKPTTWTQLLADTGPLGGLLIIHLANNDSGRMYVDLGIGVATSEVVFVPDLIFQQTTGNNTCIAFTIPILVPPNVRLSARVQSDEASKTVRVKATVVAMGGLPSLAPSRVTPYGLDVSTSGTVIDPGGSANTKGSYAPLTTNMTNPCRWLLLGIGHRKNVPGAARWALDLAIGAGGSEQIEIPDFVFYTSTTHTPETIYFGAFPLAIPAGVRLSARAQSSITSSPARTLEVVAYGID